MQAVRMANMQAFGCRSSRTAADTGREAHDVICKRDDAASQTEHSAAGTPTSRGLVAQQDMLTRAIQAHPSKRQKRSTDKINSECVNGAAQQEPLNVEIDRMAAVAAADEAAYMEDVRGPAADTVLSEISRRARGKEGINLQEAKRLPDRLGDKPLRLIVGCNNPSDHAWQAKPHALH